MVGKYALAKYTSQKINKQYFLTDCTLPVALHYFFIDIHFKTSKSKKANALSFLSSCNNKLPL